MKAHLGSVESDDLPPADDSDVEQWLLPIIREEAARHGGSAVSFDSAGVLTRDPGIVLHIGAHEFRLTIVQAR